MKKVQVGGKNWRESVKEDQCRQSSDEIMQEGEYGED